MSRWRYVKRLAPILVGLMLLLAGCGNENFSTLQPKGPIAKDQYFMMKLSLSIMIGVVIIVFAIAAYVLIRFRKRPGQTGIPVQVEGNHKLEILWTVIPIVLLLILAVPMVMTTFNFAKDYTEDPDAVQVKVTAHQFWWEFEYPKDGIVTAQELYIPVGKRVAVQLTSADVNHSFWVPALAGKTDTNPGLTNKMYLQADEVGVYEGKCAELCGFSHALMDFKVHAVSQADYDAWKAKMTAVAAVPDNAKAGETVFKTNCISCHAVSSADKSMGPNLAGFADRELVAGFRPLKNTDEYLKKWIHNPQDMKPGATMPALGLSDQEIDQVVQYLRTLK